MSVLNDISRSAVSGELSEFQGSLYDRFYVLENQNSLANGLTWIGEGYNWSGVGAAPWTTAISPTFFLANHNKPSGGAQSEFFSTNSSSENPIVHVVDDDRWHLRNQLWLGTFESPNLGNPAAGRAVT